MVSHSRVEVIEFCLHETHDRDPLLQDKLAHDVTTSPRTFQMKILLLDMETM
jgi:hypothetical protein